MKSIATILLFAVVSFAAAQSDKHTAATVEQQQGISIFIMCKPSAQNDYLGTIKMRMTWTGTLKEYLNQALKRVKKEYPSANGIIFYQDLERIDAIFIKE